MRRVLVTGGAGYIGSVVVKSLIGKNHEVVVVDNLANGKVENISGDALFYKLDLNNISDLREVFSKHEFDAVIHIAAYKSVDESMKNASKYCDNIIGTINLLKVMVEYGVQKIIFSSSAAVYGILEEGVATEETVTSPVNFYGFTKLECERIIEWFSEIHDVRYVFLRYFNVAGDVLGYIDPDAMNIFPILMENVIGKRERFTIFGDDYDTFDGTCVRDYIHVSDLADAHIKSLELNDNNIINLGTSEGKSVKEIVSATEEVTGKKLNVSVGGRRVGDPAVLLASNELAKNLLGWRPKYTIHDIISSTYEAYRKNGISE